MKYTTWIFILIVLVCFTSSAFAQKDLDKEVDLGKGWSFDETVTIPVLKLVESSRDNAQYDAALFTGIGGGICLAYSKINVDGTKDRIVTISPLTILISGDTSNEDATFFDVSYAFTVGFFNDKIMVGVGRDFGEVDDRSRWFGMLGLGIAFR